MRQGFQSLSDWGTRRSTPIALDPDCPLQDWAYPQARRGLKSPSHSESRLKPTEEPNQTIANFSPL
jgi:hypothetical protein